MEKILTQLFDLPKMINSKLPMNNFNSMVEDSEHNVANWTGKFYTVSALVILLTSLWYVLSPIWNGDMGEGSAIVGNVLSILIWVYAAFPIAQVVRSTGDSLTSSKSSIVDFIFRDLAVANIKLLGHVGALVALFGAICMTLTWATSLDVSGGVMTGWTDNIAYAYALPMAAVASLTELLNLGFVGGVLADWAAWDPTLTAGDPWSLSGLYAVLWGYVGVVAILAKLYVTLAIYYFFYGIISSLVTFIKSPYLPFKTS